VHDHATEKNIALLKNIHSALKASTNPNKCLLIIENVVSTDNTKTDLDLAKWLDLVFLVLSDSQERTLPEYKDLLKQAGFELARTIPTGNNAFQNRVIMEAKPVY